MAFSIVGPGLRDEIKLTNLFERKVVEQVDATLPVRRNEKTVEAIKTQRYGRERIRQAYDEAGSTSSYKEMTAEQLMSSPVYTLQQNTSIEEAWRFFREHRFRHVPIVNDQQQLQGIVSDRDLLAYIEQHLSRQQSADQNHPVKDIMKTRVLTATSDTSVSQIAAVFFQQRVGGMPIMKGEELVGMITRSDILGAVVYSQPVESWV